MQTFGIIEPTLLQSSQFLSLRPLGVESVHLCSGPPDSYGPQPGMSPLRDWPLRPALPSPGATGPLLFSSIRIIWTAPANTHCSQSRQAPLTSTVTLGLSPSGLRGVPDSQAVPLPSSWGVGVVTPRHPRPDPPPFLSRPSLREPGEPRFCH